MRVEGLVTMALDTAWHLAVLVVCLCVAFRVRAQSGALLIMVGVGMTLLRQIVVLLVQLEPFTRWLAFVNSDIGILMVFGVKVAAYGLIGVGVLKPQSHAGVTSRRIQFWLSVALFVSIVVDVCLLADAVAGPEGTGLFALPAHSFALVSLMLLLAIVTVRHVHNSSVSCKTAASERQIEAMMSMLAAVKHDLNNDMQVVIGNAELAAMTIQKKGDASKPVTNIADAASMAIERIDQLSVFSQASDSGLNAIDLNAVLRECATKLTSEMPGSVTLRLELEHLPTRVTADRYLLSLTLAYLIRQAVKTMEYGGEIVISSCDVSQQKRLSGKSVVSAEVFIARTANVAKLSTDQKRLANDKLFSLTLSTTKALVERSGAVSVNHSTAPVSGASLINMGFFNEAHATTAQARINTQESYV